MCKVAFGKVSYIYIRIYVICFVMFPGDLLEPCQSDCFVWILWLTIIRLSNWRSSNPSYGSPAWGRFILELIVPKLRQEDGKKDGILL